MVELLLAWLPLIVIFAILIWFGVGQTRSYQRHVEEVKAVNDELVAINRKMVAELGEIKTILKDRN